MIRLYSDTEPGFFSGMFDAWPVGPPHGHQGGGPVDHSIDIGDDDNTNDLSGQDDDMDKFISDAAADTWWGDDDEAENMIGGGSSNIDSDPVNPGP